MKDKKLSRTSAIVLAAGMSTRMGTLKQLLPYKNTNILNYILGQLKKSYLDQIILVLGYKHEEIKTLVDLCGVDLIINSNYTDEMLLSLKLGLEKLLLTSHSVLVVLGDQPLIDYRLINDMIKSFEDNKSVLLAPEHDGKLGHPVIIHRKFKNEINNLNSNIGLRSLFDNHSNYIFHYKTNYEGILSDIDTPDDYNKLIKNNDN